ncbi:MAG: GntR family transcriptional regulator [Chitinivibrionales bacterium]|nr:GntR family transcriptional regulator [Chitinivibrionales bacterium]
MWKATQKLQKQGILSSIKGHYIIINKPDSDHQESSGQSLIPDRAPILWEKIKAQLAKDILNHVFPPDNPLPSLKELQHHYHINFRTLRKALDALVEEGIIIPRNRGYAVAAVAKRRSNVRIILVGHWENGHLALGMHDETFLRSLEVSCAQAEIPLELIGVEKQENGIFPRLIGSGEACNLSRGDEVLGYLYLSNIADDTHTVIVNSLAQTKKPVAVLDETGAWPAVPRHLSSRLFRFFRNTISPVPAQQVARLLLSLEHKRIAYISPFHANVWSIRRIEGLQSVYKEAGNIDNVVPFVEALSHKQEAVQRTDIGKLIDYYEQWKTSIPDEFKIEIDPVVELIRTRAVRWGELRYKLNPLFDKLCNDRSISAWVFPTDFLGTIAQDYLNDKGYKVPDDISVISFDDSYRALRNGLTSYNFNMPAAVNAMLGFVTNSYAANLPSKNGIVEIEGMIVERGSLTRK